MASAAPASVISVLPQLSAVIAQTSPRDRALGDMQAFLASAHPQTPSEALRLLRNAYPEAPLSLRVAACGIA